MTISPLSQQPLVSVVIVTYNRPDALAQSLDSVLRQSYPNREIIVVDNNSTTPIAPILDSRGPGIRLIHHDNSAGPCGGRNAGIQAARGAIVVILDNDVLFASPSEIDTVVAQFQANPGFHVLAFRMVDPSGRLRIREWCHARDAEQFGHLAFETFYFVEGGCAFRKEVFDSSGVYYEPLFIGCEGHDLSLRVLDRGFRILYCPEVNVVHLMSGETRTSDRPFYFYTRNYIWIAYKDYRLWDGASFLAPKLAMMLLHSLRARRLGAFFRGLRAGVNGLRAIHRDRTPIAPPTVALLKDMERWRPNLIARLRRHREAVQI